MLWKCIERKIVLQASALIRDLSSIFEVKQGKKGLHKQLPSEVINALAAFIASIAGKTKLLLRRRRRRRRRAVLSCQLPPLRAEGSKNKQT